MGTYVYIILLGQMRIIYFQYDLPWVAQTEYPYQILYDEVDLILRDGFVKLCENKSIHTKVLLSAKKH